ncbi:MAG: hypothetical protein ACE3JK_03335 [Sporolactobacillus sp.]
MSTLLRNIIVEETGSIPSTSKLAEITKLSRSTISDALKRPISHTSFGVASKILHATSLSLDAVAKAYVEKERTPAEEEILFLQASDLDTLTIMGVKFSTAENFWKTRDSILNSIYEGAHPTKTDVLDAYRQLEEHVPTDQLISKLFAEYKGK